MQNFTSSNLNFNISIKRVNLINESFLHSFAAHISALIAGNLDQIVPVHQRPDFVLQAVCLLNLCVRCHNYSLVLDLLAGLLSAVVEKRHAGLLGFVLANLALLQSLLFLLAKQAHVEPLRFHLTTLLHFLLIRYDQQLLGHPQHVNAANV